jgi:hypothetical protein
MKSSSPACASLDTEEECLELCQVWREATPEEKHHMGVKIGAEVSRLLRSEARTTAEMRADLARFVRKEILSRRERSRTRGRSKR